MDFWFIKFHWLGVKEKEEASILVRVQQPDVPGAHIWRFAEIETLDLASQETLQRALDSPVGKLEPYHIVMLEVGV